MEFFLSLHWWENLFRKHFWRAVGASLLLFFIFSVFLIYHFERQYDPYLSIFDAFRIVLVFFLGEYGDTPKTLIGRVLSVILFILGIGVVAALIGKIASIFVEMKVEVKMPKELESHLVICNWHDSGDRIVRELHSPLAAPETDILIVSKDEIDELELRNSPAYEKVYFIRSDPTMHDVLRRARAHHAKSVIILADPHCSDPDAQTALISLAITKLERHVKRKPHIIAEVINPQKVQHLIDAGVDEWVCSANYGLGILAQSALFGKISDVYQQLLTYSEETNEIYLIDEEKYPESFLGKTFQEIAQILNNDRNPTNPCILLGIKRDERVVLNPKKEDFITFQSGDSLIVMSFDQPDLTYLK
ncbi:potassium transporter [candidate division KSB3 bacterium]|uniref:Potassium transporter n=1 Tax=candidate division KSB3 bacterium TaxID=2044937 RepID=A0A2G6K7K7_9BACT|nr:MAG: potassium transporter [candidate division KSB3 bacterium]